MSKEEAVKRADAVAREVTQSRPRNWNRLLSEWTRFIGEVEDGYRFTIYEYHNDLDTRAAIEDVLNRVAADDRQQLQADVDGIDRRFEAATREIDQIIATNDRGFWARRIPTKLVGELAEDIRLGH